MESPCHCENPRRSRCLEFESLCSPRVWSSPCVSWNSDLQAQTSGGLGGPLGSSLLSKPAVQEELQLTKEQKSKLQEVTAAWNQQRQERLETIRNSLSGGTADPETIRTQILAIREEGDTAVAKILTRSQRIRLEQIVLQQEGLGPSPGRRSPKG